MDADRRRTLAAAAVAAAALAALPAAAAGARADRGPIAFTQFDAVRATSEDGGVPGTIAADGEPAFSPDGTHVLMTRVRPGVGPSGRQMDLRIVLIDPDGRPPRQDTCRRAGPGRRLLGHLLARRAAHRLPDLACRRHRLAG